VQHQADPDSPLLIIQNKCDRPEQEVLQFPIPEETLKGLEARPWRRPLCVSAQERRWEAALREALSYAIAWLRDPARLGVPKIGAGRLRVQRRLEALHSADMTRPPDQRRHRLLEQHEFEAICTEEGGVTSRAHLLAYLDANGTVFYRRGLFKERIVLDQSWALEAIYTIFDRQRVYPLLRRYRGQFTRSELNALVWQQHSGDEQKLLLDMMEACGICFRYRQLAGSDDEVEYIAPDLLPERKDVDGELVGRWDEGRSCETAVFRYAFLHGGLIRTIMSTIGQEAELGPVYWRGGLWAYEATTRSRLMIEEVMTGSWQGEIRIRTQDGDAATLLQRLVPIVEKAQAQLGLSPLTVERSSLAADIRDEAPMKFGQEKPREPEWYVSYAWGEDKTPEGRERERIVDELCATARARAHIIRRDKEVLGLGDSISKFMKRIGAGDRIFAILSDKYLRSSFCMFELSEIWRTSRQESSAFLKRVRVYTLGDADIWKPRSRLRYAAHWKEEHDKMEADVHKVGLSALSGRSAAEFRQMGEFYRHVDDILATLADIVQPRSFDELIRYGFDEDRPDA